jgi:hypothetical protein
MAMIAPSVDNGKGLFASRIERDVARHFAASRNERRAIHSRVSRFTASLSES